MRTDLKVPFAEKDEAKKLGCRWDATKKVWYIQNVEDMNPFAKWLGIDPVDLDAGTKAPKKSSAAKTSTSEGIKTVGSLYKELPRVCDCSPWEVCDKCRATALNC